MTEKGNFQSTEMHWEGAGTGPEEHLRSERNTSPGQAATEPPLHASNIGGASTIHETSARLQIPVIVQGEPSGYGYGYPHPGNHSQQWFYRPALEFYLEYAQQQQSQLHQMQQFQWQGTDAEGTRTVGSNSPIPTQNPGIYGYPYASYPRVESQPQPQRNQMQHYSVPVVDVEACFDEMAQAIDINKADAHVDTQQQIGGDKVSSGNQPALEAAVAACLNKTEPFRTDSGVLASGTEMEGAPKQASSPQSMILPAQSEGSKYLQNVLSVGAAAKGVSTCGHGDARLISSCLTQEICVDLAQSEQQIQTDPLLLQFASKEASKASSIRTSVHHELPPDFQQAESGVVTDCGAGEYTHSKHSERSENESEDQMKVSITEASALHHFPTTSIEYLKQTSFASRRQQEAIILRTENQQQSTLVQRDASERTVQSPSTLLMNGNQETSTTEISSVYTASPGHLQCNRQIPVSVAENQQHQTRFTPFSICSKPPSLNGKSHFQSSISLTESQLPHSSAASLNKSQQEWIDSIVGRDWEVFWKQGSSRTTLKYDPCVETAFAQAFSTVHESSAFVDADDMPLNMLVQQRKDNTDDDVSDNSADADHEEDWYDATVHMFDRPGESEGSATLSLHFRVSFVGDDEIYFMILTPETVRPSARGWIRRARAVLRQPLADAKDHDQKCWEDSLPPDTRTMADRVALESIQKDVLETFPVTKYDSFYSSDGDANAAFQKLRREHATCCQLMQLIRSQIFLRSRLTYIDSQDTNESSLDIDKDDDSDPTEPYIDFLNKCLQELDQSCQWHFRCWGLLYRLFAVRRQYQLHVSISRDFLLNQCLSNGRINLATILANKDTSPKASRSALKGRKRCVSVASSPQDVLSSPSRPLSARRRAKRRRKSYGFSDHWLVSSGIQSKSDETEEEEDLLTTDIIKIFVETVCHADKRWYTQHFGNMLLSISSMVMTPYVKWERSAQFFLGERDTLDEGTSDGETTAEDSDEDDNDDGHVIAQGDHMRAGGRRYVRYEEIESLLESANHGRLLQCFDLTDYVTKLCNKLAAIDSFETRAWDLIASVLDETAKDVEHAATFLWDKDNDSTQKGLQALLQEALRKGGPIENMYSIGRVSSPLSREVIENAMVYRAWFLDLKYAESVRERVAFVDGVVSRLSKLPPLPSKSGSLDQFMNVVALRVRALAAKYLDCVAIFNRYQTMLTERVLPKNSSDRKGLLSLEGARETLHELQQLPVISSAEEMVAIRNDVLDWEANARSILLKWKPAFCEVSDLKKAVDRILDGTSKTREDTKRGKKYSSAVEAEMKAFAHADVHNLCGPLYSQTITLFAASAAWKDRADSVLNVLRAFGDGGKLAIGFQKPTCMVDLKRIEDLMSEYPGLEVDLPETFDRLCKIRETALKWSSLVSAYLLDDSLSFDDSLSLVERMGLERPPGIIVDPSRQVLDLLGDLLRWYGTLKDFVSTSSRDNEFRHTLLVTGLQVVERFTRKQKTSDQFDVPDNAMELLMASSVHRKSTRTLIIVSKLDASPLSRAVLERMTDKSRDDREGSPLFFLRLLLWAYFVDDFVARCIDPEASRSHTTLTVATVLQKARPYKCGVLSSNDMENVSLSDLRIAEFNHLVSKGEEREQEAREAICNSKYLLRECRTGAVESHLVRLKDLSMDFKSRASSSGNVILDFRLEQHLEQDVKLFGWLVSIACISFVARCK